MQALNVLLPVGYLAATFLHALRFAGVRSLERTRAGVTLAAVALHALAVGWHAVEGASLAAVAGGWNALSLVALSVAVLQLWIRFRVRHAGTGAFVFAAVFLMQLAASAFGPVAPAAGETGTTAETLLVFHVASVLAATSTLILSGIHGALYLTLFRRMRRHELSPFARALPDLEHLARMTRGSAFAGFVLLGLGLNLGIWWAHSAGVADFSYGDPFVLVMLSLWVHFGVVAFSQFIPGITARRASFAAVAGFAILVASLLLSLWPQVTFHAQA